MFFLLFPVESFVDIQIRSRGCDDPGKTLTRCGRAYIKVNGENYAPRKRGHNVVTVDANTGKMVLYTTARFSFECRKQFRTIGRILLGWVLAPKA